MSALPIEQAGRPAATTGEPRVLHVELIASETSAPYNEHCLPKAGERPLAVCSYFDSPVEPPSGILLYGGGGSPLGFLRALARAVDEFSPSIVHVHTPHVGLLFILLAVVRPSLWHRSVYTVHNCYENFRWRNRLLMIPVFAAFRRIVCCSHASFESFPGLFRWLARDRLRAVPNGLDVDRVVRMLGDRVQARECSGPPTVVSIGRLMPIKNPLGTVDAFLAAGLEDAHLAWIGEGPLEAPVRARGEELGERLELRGLLPRDAVYGALAEADLFVSTSHGEGLPLAPLEAMACGCPVVLSDIAPHREIAAGTDFVPLVSPDDAAGFGREIRRVMSLPEAERRAIGRECAAWVRERFSLTRMHEGYAAIYAELG